MPESVSFLCTESVCALLFIFRNQAYAKVVIQNPCKHLVRILASKHYPFFDRLRPNSVHKCGTDFGIEFVAVCGANLIEVEPISVRETVYVFCFGLRASRCKTFKTQRSQRYPQRAYPGRSKAKALGARGGCNCQRAVFSGACHAHATLSDAMRPAAKT